MVCQDDPPFQRVDFFDGSQFGDAGPAVLPLIGKKKSDYALPARFQQQAEFFVQGALFFLR